MKRRGLNRSVLCATAVALAMTGSSAAQDPDNYCAFGMSEGDVMLFPLFDRLDTDHDGRLTVNEYRECLADVNAEETERARLLDDFRELDVNEDEALVRAELERAVAVNTDANLGQEQSEALEADVIALSEWRYDDIYRDGFSAEEFIDEREVLSTNGENIGDVEDLIADMDGRIIAVIAEVGGFWDMGDTHVAIPFDQVDIRAAGIIVPITEDTVDNYDLFDTEHMTAAEVSDGLVGGVDNAATGARSFRISELIGDYARLSDGGIDVGTNAARVNAPRNYGYVNDVIIRDGEIAAVVVNPATGYGTPGYYAYPYYGRGYGFEPGAPYYDTQYTQDEIGDLEPFEYGRMEAS